MRPHLQKVPTHEGLTLRWCESDMHSAETVLPTSNSVLFSGNRCPTCYSLVSWQGAVWLPVMWGRQGQRPILPAHALPAFLGCRVLGAFKTGWALGASLGVLSALGLRGADLRRGFRREDSGYWRGGSW